MAYLKQCHPMVVFLVSFGVAWWSMQVAGTRARILVVAFTAPSTTTAIHRVRPSLGFCSASRDRRRTWPVPTFATVSTQTSHALAGAASNDDSSDGPTDDGNSDDEAAIALVSSSSLSTPTSWLVGVTGTVAGLVTLYSEYTLKTTGCGIPAGPLGVFGLIEGLSYLTVTGIAAYSLVTKLRTGQGLPAGPAGLVGAAEGLSFLAIVVGLVVLVLQVIDYGYIPNAVPVEGGICS
jgi:hypothetical protein